MGKWYETEIAKKILENKYYHEGEDFDNFVDRVCSIFSDGMKSRMHEALYKADFFPAGRTLYGAGSKGKFKASMSNCYILPSPEDNIESIFSMAGKMGRICSYGGGVGINISTLRPRGATVNNSARTSTGAVSFMDVYDVVGKVIGANNRRAALMIGLDANHPDILEFIESKQNTDKINSANISILFQDKVLENNTIQLIFNNNIYGTISREKLLNRFAESAWNWGEPGAIFIDTVREYNLLSGYDNYNIDISNPCAEYFGNAYNSCNLGSINLYNCVTNPFTSDASLDEAKLFNLVELGVSALDEILDYGYDMQPLPENKKCIDDWRAIGLGVFGLADMLAALGIKYGSPLSKRFVNDLFHSIFRLAVNRSCRLAKEKGAFKQFDLEKTKNSPLWEYISDIAKSDIEKYGLRNGSLLSIAPTGSISTMCGLSGGIEPHFRLEYERTTHALENSGEKFKIKVKAYEDAQGRNESSFITAEQIPWKERIDVQAAIQKYVDNAISSTVNLPNSATIEDVKNAYLYAWETGCKGLTVFRDGCSRAGILMSSTPTKVEQHKYDYIFPEKRGGIKCVEGITVAGHTACAKNIYTTVNKRDGNVFEVFTNPTGGCKANISTITRLASLALRCGVKVEEVVSELRSNVCPACTLLQRQGRTDIANSCGGCIGDAISEAYSGTIQKYSEGLECPSCKSKSLRPEGKCYNCPECGFSKCD